MNQYNERRPRVLIIDDEDNVRSTVAMMLEGSELDIVQARNGNDGLAAMEKALADVVITDIIMPDKEGIETIVEMRRRWPETRIVAMSGGGRTSNFDFLEIARKFGADEILHKPFDADAVVETVHRLLATTGDAAR